VELARIIESRRREVLGRWKELVRTLNDARHLSEPSLEDHVPELLDWLVSRLRTRGGTDILEGQALSRVHAFERDDADFDLVTVLAELGALRDVLLGLWVEEPGQVRPREVHQLNQDLDEVVTICVTDFTRRLLARHGAPARAAGPEGGLAGDARGG
jgi:hypothetical protein